MDDTVNNVKTSALQRTMMFHPVARNTPRFLDDGDGSSGVACSKSAKPDDWARGLGASAARTMNRHSTRGSKSSCTKSASAVERWDWVY